ncbi:MAG: bacillithiol system redox-active protein YtxJ [Anaerolineae bacterium]|nr:bacillithiol system redox-active protein YtxJ [Anaerolineae bacterium]
MIQDLETVQDYEQMLSRSRDRPAFLLKHSTRCPISASRWQEFQTFAGREIRADFYRVLVVENRPLSMHIVDDTGVQHQSPQAFLFSRGQVVWNGSHRSITPDSMLKVLETALM